VQPFVGHILPQASPPELVWLLDLATHWQWLYACLAGVGAFGLLLLKR
jgi:hypothetical protein